MNRLFIKVKPGAAKTFVEKIDDMHFIVSVTEPPIQGRANAAIIKALAEYFNLPPAHFKIISGFKERNKVIEVM